LHDVPLLKKLWVALAADNADLFLPDHLLKAQSVFDDSALAKWHASVYPSLVVFVPRLDQLICSEVACLVFVTTLCHFDSPFVLRCVYSNAKKHAIF